MTFGTVAAGEEYARHVYAASVDALAGLPVTVLLTTGKNAPSDLVQNVPDNVVVRQFVPQAEIFEHAQLMVCHGGSGTVLGGLASGVPMIVVPLFADQPDNARCLASAGLCISISDADMPSLRAAIADVLENPEMRRRAGQAANDFAAMPTVEDALEILVGG
jgi:MGT family glycosyltransferase